MERQMKDGSGLLQDASASSSARVRDVADFQARWGEFRGFAAGALGRGVLTVQEETTLHWMIEVMDRIGRRDLAAQKDGDCAP